MNKRKILVIDDEEFIRDLVRDFLELKDISCDGTENPNLAEDLYAENKYDLVLLDVNLGKSNAENIIGRLKKISVDTPILLLTGDTQFNDEYAKKIGAEGIIFKPFQVDYFIDNIAKILEIE